MNEADKDPQKNIIIKGSRVHNLKNIDVAIPKNKLVVVTGMWAQVNRPWLLIPCMPRASAAM